MNKPKKHLIAALVLFTHLQRSNATIPVDPMQQEECDTDLARLLQTVPVIYATTSGGTEIRMEVSNLQPREDCFRYNGRSLTLLDGEKAIAASGAGLVELLSRIARGECPHLTGIFRSPFVLLDNYRIGLDPTFELPDELENLVLQEMEGYILAHREITFAHSSQDLSPGPSLRIRRDSNSQPALIKFIATDKNGKECDLRITLLNVSRGKLLLSFRSELGSGWVEMDLQEGCGLTDETKEMVSGFISQMYEFAGVS
jgi:hypothetical protein